MKSEIQFLMNYSYLSEKRGLFFNFVQKIILNFKNCNSAYIIIILNIGRDFLTF